MMHHRHRTQSPRPSAHKRRQDAQRAQRIGGAAASVAHHSWAVFACQVPEGVRVAAWIHAGEYDDGFLLGHGGEGEGG